MVSSNLPKYPHLKLKDWPFRLVPDEEFCSFMGDREQLQADLAGLMRNLSRRPTSSMHLMWAWYGSGKTHTLRHIEHLCTSQFPQFIPIYVEFPKEAKHFLDLYSGFIGRIKMAVLNKAYEDVFTSQRKQQVETELRFDFPDLANGLMYLYAGNRQEQDLAVRWLRGECREVRLLKTIGISRPIQTAEDGLKVLAWLVRILNLAGNITGSGPARVIWMIDEFQRIADCREPLRIELNSCLHSAFNRCPNSLTVILSFTGSPKQKGLPDWLAPEVRDRVGIEKVFLLPPLTKDDGVQFIADVLSHFRANEGSPVNRTFPFGNDTAEYIIEQIQVLAKRARNEGEPKPRTIMHFFNRVLEEAEPLMEQRKLEFINKEFADRVLKGIVIPPDHDGGR